MAQDNSTSRDCQQAHPRTQAISVGGGGSYQGSNQKTGVTAIIPPTPTSSVSSVSSAPSSTPQTAATPSSSPAQPLPHGTTHSQNMAPGSSRRPNTPKRELDVSSILTMDQRNELNLLVARITDGMHRQLCKTFDSTDADARAAPLRKPWHTMFPNKLKDNSLSLGGRGSRARGEDSAIERESHEPRLVELKKEAVAAFRKWQSILQRRVSDLTAKGATSKPGQSYASIASSGPVAGKSASNTAAMPRKQENKTTVMQADAALVQLFPPTATSLCLLPLERRTILLHAMLLLILSLEHYSPNSRILLLHLAASLHVAPHVLADDEVRVAGGFARMIKDLPADELLRKKTEECRGSRRWKAGPASAGGISAPGAMGGLAAPLVAVGVGNVTGGVGLGATLAAGLLGPLADGGIAVGSLFGLCSARPTARIMDQCTREVQDFAFLPMHGAVRSAYRDAKDIAPDDRRLTVTVCISGWLYRAEDAQNPWRALGHHSEVFALRWELEALMKMGGALETVFRSAAWSLARKEITARAARRRARPAEGFQHDKPGGSGPVFADLVDGIWPLGLLKVSKIIDNPWSVCMVRADKAGVVLADSIINKVQGERGVTLIGYSLGARVIYSCLMTLAERRQFGLVASAVMMGAPAPSQSRIWSIMRSVVAGRLVNVYSENDYILGFLYRTSSVQYGVAGLQAIEAGFGVENVDASDMISGHLRYQYLVGSILKHMSWEDVDLDRVAKDTERLEEFESRARELELNRAKQSYDGPAVRVW